MAGKFVCVSSDEDLKERVELPDRVVLVNNGAFDLEQKGLSGFYVWIGYRHDDSGSSEISMKSVLQKTTHSVGKWLQEYAGTKYEVDDFWKDLEMYRVWAGGENMDVDRKKKDESIEIKEDCQIPGTDIILEKGDVIHVVNEASDAYDKYLDDVHNTKEYQAYSKEFAKLGYFNLYTLKYDGNIEVNIRQNWESKNDYHPSIYYNIKSKKIDISTVSYGSLDLNNHQTFINHVIEGHKAAELLVKLMNDKKYWDSIPDISTYK